MVEVVFDDDVTVEFRDLGFFFLLFFLVSRASLPLSFASTGDGCGLLRLAPRRVRPKKTAERFVNPESSAAVDKSLAERARADAKSPLLAGTQVKSICLSRNVPRPPSGDATDLRRIRLHHVQC